MSNLIDYWFVLILVAAFSHAIWNLLLKSSEQKEIFLWSLRVWSFIIFLPISIYFWPEQPVSIIDWIVWGLGSAILHSIYALILSKAYEKNDFTLVYPIARGTGPLIVVIVGIFILKEEVGLITLLGVSIIMFGIYVLYSGFNLKLGLQTLKMILQSPWPLFVGVAIASYTIFDKMAVAFVPPIILNLIDNLGQIVILGNKVRLRGRKAIFEQWKKHWIKMAVAGGLAGLAYILVLIVMTEVPVSYVSPLRETSIVIGSILGFLFLKENFGVNKLLGSIIIFAGVVIIVW
ncbi:DMT family transporter [Chengkuizengella sediminis]|uniref:DMT family transporter n=1 Tax=Chengkuizengella sediminis TaxID=1885917 RepID=UPI00138A444E|nr:DMT family transporter [Chengkuizengella sediminis]NDI33892.1 EamA family transporter [Chengkuizengella sediminis]